MSVTLTHYKPVPSGMSFDLDTGPDKTAYMLSTPGNTATVSLAGSGTWSVEVLSSVDGTNYNRVANLTTPGQWRYDTKGAAAVAIRVESYTNGQVAGMLAHGSLVPVTNVSALFGSFLIFSYNATPSEPPTGNQIRFNSAVLAQVTKVWIANTTVDGVDQFHAIRHIPHGGTLLVQEKANHADAVLFSVTGPTIDKGAYVEIPVVFQEAGGTPAASQVIVAAFNPGPVLSLTPVAATGLPAPELPTPEPKAGKGSGG